MSSDISSIDKGSVWRIFDHLLDAIFIVDSSRRLYFANESFSNLCDVPPRAIASHEVASKYVTIPEDLWERLAGSEILLAEDAVISAYREIDFSSRSGEAGRAQVLVDVIREPALSVEPLFCFILRDVTVEMRLVQKYKSQVENNERLISELQRNLEETSFLRQLAVDLPIHSETSALLKTISTRLKADLGFRDAQFFNLSEDDPDFLKPIAGDPRIGSLLREVIRDLAPMIRARNETGDTSPSFIHKPFGTYWYSWVQPKTQQPSILVTSMGHEGNDIDRKTLFESLTSQIGTLIDSRTLYVASITDSLTGIFNRRFFDSRFEMECQMARERGAPVSLILLDIDFFKKINDTYGHPAGDAILAILGNVIRKRVRGEDIAARIGGEEFALLLPDTNPQDAKALAEDLRKRIGELSVGVPGSDQKMSFTISLGIAGLSVANDTPDLIYRAADEALYEAKGSGRNKTVVHDTVA